MIIAWYTVGTINGVAIKPHTCGRQSLIPSRPNRRGLKVRKPKTREEAEINKYWALPILYFIIPNPKFDLFSGRVGGLQGADR